MNDFGKLPPDPDMADTEMLLKGARATYAMYNAYVLAGFSEQQALMLTMSLMATASATAGSVIPPPEATQP